MLSSTYKKVSHPETKEKHSASTDEIKVAVLCNQQKFSSIAGVLKKVETIFEEASSNSVELVVFPELYISDDSIHIDMRTLESIGELACTYKINAVIGFEETEGHMKYISQCIIANKGNVALKRRKLRYSKQNEVTFKRETISSVEVSALLSFSTGTLEVGCSLGYEIINPLNIFNAATQQVKIEVCCFGDENSFDGVSYEYIGRAFAQQAQCYFIMASSSKCITNVYAPDGSSVIGANNNKELHFRSLKLDRILAQKNLIDVVGHYSRPDIISLHIHQD